MPTSPKARIIVKAVHGQIITLSEDSLKAVDDIVNIIAPRKFNITFGGTNIIYGFPSGIPEWNGLTKNEKHQALHK